MNNNINIAKPTIYKHLLNNKKYIFVACIFCILAYGATFFGISSNQIEEVESTFRSECEFNGELHDDFRNCLRNAKNKVTTYKKVSVDRQMEMLVKACLNDAMLGNAIADQEDLNRVLEGGHAIGRLRRCENKAADIMAGNRF